MCSLMSFINLILFLFQTLSTGDIVITKVYFPEGQQQQQLSQVTTTTIIIIFETTTMKADQK